METSNNKICPNCRFARMSGKVVTKCQRGLFIDLAFRYNKCKRFEPRIKPNAELCPKCEYFYSTPEGDGCLHDISDADVKTDAMGVISYCRHFHHSNNILPLFNN